MLLNLLRLWTGPLPKEEIFPDRKYNPLVHWFIHPIKRHLAKYYLLLLQKFFGLTVIGITGSVGKTITKNMLLAILPHSFATTDNTTSTFNIPTTILKTLPFTKYLILEMSIEYLGDMDFYLWLAKPDIAVITPINLTHTQFLGNIETITSEKYRIAKFAKHIITSENIKPSTIYRLPSTIVGSHFQLNAALAAKTAQLLNIPQSSIESGISSFSPPSHRMQFIKLKSGSILIDDVHNANPLATKEALKTLVVTAKKYEKTPVFVFAQMNELGSYEKSSHEEIGQLLKKLKLRIKNLELMCLGPATKYTIQSAGFGEYFDSQEELYKKLSSFLDASHCTLIKGSRSWHLENLVEKLKQAS